MAQRKSGPPVAPKPKNGPPVAAVAARPRGKSPMRNVMMKSKIGDALMVAAFDIGTSYSGYAYSTKGEFNENPLRISTNNQWHGSRRSTMKCPTILLVTPGQAFHSFGYSAQAKYKALIETDKDNNTTEHQLWGYFSGFKMHLHRDQNLCRGSRIEAANGMFLPVITVFQMVIEFLQGHLLKCLNIQAIKIEKSEIQWIITVPALWSDAAKQMMREAALQSGIIDQRFTLALEPETAAIYCHLDYSKRQEEACQNTASFNKPGTKLILCDLGGGTADISVLEVQDDGKLKQLYEAGGGPWGGTTVDGEVMSLLRSLVGEDVMQRFAELYPEEYLNLQEEIETAKRAFSSQTASQPSERLSILFPSDIKDVYEDMKSPNKFTNLVKLPRNSIYSGMLKIVAGKIVFQGDTLERLFNASLQGVVNYLSMLFAIPEHQNIDLILLVGGFSASAFMEEQIRKAYPSKKVIVPRDAELSVVKGAVIFGHNPFMISQRIVRYTYGVNYAPDFKEGEHDPEKRYTDQDGKDLCADCFAKFVERGQAIKPEEPVIQLFFPNSKQTSMTFQVYKATVNSPLYVTDRNCTSIGKLDVPMPDVSHGKKRTVVVAMLFGETELKVSANLEGSDAKVEASIDCLENILV